MPVVDSLILLSFLPRDCCASNMHFYRPDTSLSRFHTYSTRYPPSTVTLDHYPGPQCVSIILEQRFIGPLGPLVAEHFLQS
ncbi:hypothetical protein K503DRAFT_564308 [Rhizopogon vinicolor AM-OR11-026]|uniref:Secreted protein n=1 Tax=Rhizopogon vinicolor AM-OR11-026 TaxID=1314800 RepID=A0A1B7N7T8_9AGAM|nr:hypothetical protein K503DRAFT_564308 [Rhizopogon vinicolor AM-OR11-026]